MIAKQPSMDEKATNTATYRTEENLEEPIDVELLTISSNSESILSKNQCDKMDKKLIEREKVKQEKRMENLTPAPAMSPMGQNCKSAYYTKDKFETQQGR